jgi:hypothetical protein
MAVSRHPPRQALLSALQAAGPCSGEDHRFAVKNTPHSTILAHVPFPTERDML